MRIKSIIVIISILLAQNVFSQNLKKLIGTEFPEEVKNVRLFTVNNKEIKLNKVLDSLTGQKIFLDFWASWCGPCVREMEHSKFLQKKVKDQNVAFVFFSTDINEKDWQKGLKRIKIKGHHFRLKPEDKHFIKDLFKIRGIPYYVILNKEGKILDPRAPWPREARLQLILRDDYKN